jgi:uncharacterized protein
MKAFMGVVLAAGLLAAGGVRANATQASDASIHKLMEVTHAQTMIDSMFAQMESMMKQSALQTAGHPLDAQEQQILSRNMDKLMGVMQAQMSWSKLEPVMTTIYRNNFSEKEIDDMLAFYQTPTGQAVIAKMPVVMQQGMQMGRAQVQQVLPQLQQINQQMAQEFRDYEASKTGQANKS